MTIYRIKDWDDNFENNRTRDMKRTRWVPVPNKQDGDGYTILVDHKNGAAHLGAWLALLQVASKCTPRGTLLRDNGKPHTPQSMSRMSGLTVKVFDEVMPRLIDDEIGWLEATDNKGVVTIPHPPAEIPHPPAQKGREGKGIEWKGKEVPAALAASSEFRKVWEEWKTYRKEKQKQLTPTTVTKQLKKLDTMGVDKAIKSIETSMTNGWVGLFEPDEPAGKKPKYEAWDDE